MNQRTGMAMGFTKSLSDVAKKRGMSEEELRNTLVPTQKAIVIKRQEQRMKAAYPSQSLCIHMFMLPNGHRYEALTRQQGGWGTGRKYYDLLQLVNDPSERSYARLHGGNNAIPARSAARNNGTANFNVPSSLPPLASTTRDNDTQCSAPKHNNSSLSIEIPPHRFNTFQHPAVNMSQQQASGSNAVNNAAVPVNTDSEHTVPADGTFETGLKDGDIICGNIKDVIHANLMQLIAKFNTKDVLNMLIEAHRAGPNDTTKVLDTKGLDTRVTKAFRQAAQGHGYGDTQAEVQRFRQEVFNPVARANGRAESRNHAAEKAATEAEISAAADALLDSMEAFDSNDGEDDEE
ncbi:hypothetical protein CERZMDRAFT_102538 [Cercospora zeae-maydis SCOH1-5]|uniref:Uncharacterized protein n=1 Tax=Cercospora zeae-maydis SCOH1-5 TaxID=717836 RepID=A0A6A6F1E7_9PEZI|nr:hypothetical protein CERZMDRAFT_102538 [Cercospora zeae-maydis SCOH1-5]